MRTYYGWFDAVDGAFRISAMPPDAPVRPSVPVKEMDEVKAMLKRKRARILWWPPLPDHLAASAA